MSDPRKFLKNSDYPMDKVVLMVEGSIVLNNWDLPYSKAINHGLPFTPLVMGSWSFTPDFASSKDFGLLIYASPSVEQVTLLTTATQIQFGALFNNDNNRTIYYRLYAFAPSDYAGDVLAPNVNTGFRINSDLNYMKLWGDGVIAFAGATPRTINHGLGYKPMVLAWVQTSGGISKHTVDDFDATYGQLCNITTTQLIIRDVGGYGAYQRLHYRIYYDD